MMPHVANNGGSDTMVQSWLRSHDEQIQATMSFWLAAVSLSSPPCHNSWICLI